MIIDLKQILKKMKADAFHHQAAIEQYVCKVQEIFSMGLVLFFATHLAVITLMEITGGQRVNGAFTISFLQMLLCLGAYFLFRGYFNTHRKHVISAAYLNIFQVLMLLELQYFLYDEYVSFTVVICLLLSTSVTLIGHIRKYCTIITFVALVDIATTMCKNIDLVGFGAMNLYIIDSLFMVLIATSINICCCQLNYQAFDKEQQIIYLSERDALTGLFNRKALQTAVQTYAAENTLCAMILLDLDNFKLLNDTLGHFEGDTCLKDVAQGLSGLFRQTDCVSRLGGDEFVIFMPKLRDRNFVTARTKEILKTIGKTYANAKGEVSITCSIGVAFSTEQDIDLYQNLYRAADAAMYRSKQRGKNCVSYAEGDTGES